MWNITIDRLGLFYIIEELYKFYDSYSIENKLTLKKLRDRFNYFPPSIQANINIEEITRTLIPLVITIEYYKKTEEFIFDDSKLIFHLQKAMSDYYSNVSNTATTSTSNTLTVTTADLINSYSNYTTSTGSMLYSDIYTTTAGRTTTDMIREIVDDYEKEKEKENKKMETNFNFGPYSSNSLRLSIYGIAVKNNNSKWVTYNKESGKLIDVEILNFDIDTSKIFYKFPKPTDSVEKGDILLHNGKIVFVETVREDDKFDVVDPSAGTFLTILPLTSPFGFNFVETIISIADYLPAADKDNPFGNLLPLMLMGNNKDNSLLPIMLMMDKDIDPMMMLLLGGKGDNLSTILMMSMMKKKKNKDKVKEVLSKIKEAGPTVAFENEK